MVHGRFYNILSDAWYDQGRKFFHLCASQAVWALILLLSLKWLVGWRN